MSKQEVLEELQKARFKPSKGKAWKDAFALYAEETGDKTLSMKCNMCYRKVAKWISDG